jgi:acetolactate synthase-1/2/3 large subunit
MGRVNGGEVLVRAMQAQGIETLFSISDIGQSPMLRSAEQAGLRQVSPRHESAGVHMADGWARASGGLAAVAGAAGPGVANMVPGLVCASVEGVPLLAIGTQRVRRSLRAVRHGRFQFSPQLDVVRSVTKFASRVEEAIRLPEFVAEAVRRALDGRPGPSFLEIPGDVLLEEVDEDEVTVPDPARTHVTPGAPDPAAVREAAEVLAGADFPLVLAGHGVHRAGAAAELRDLAEQAGALVMTTAGARGAFPESHPQSAGMVFPWGSPAHLQSDVIVAVGTQLGESTQYLGSPAWAGPDSQRLIHLDADPLQIGVNREVDVALVGDAAAGLAALTGALADLGPARSPGEAATAYATELRAFRQAVADGYAEIDTSPVHPGRLAVQLARSVPEDTIVCFDGGNTGLWAHLAFSFDHPRSLLWTGHLGHLGTGLPYAIGAKLAEPERPVVLFSGDGAFGFNIQELETAAREQVPVVVVVNCDFAWGMEELYMEKVAGTTIGVKHTEVRYDEVARALGCGGELVDAPGELGPALERALSAEVPTVVQVVVDDRENVHPPGLDEFHGMYEAEST